MSFRRRNVGIGPSLEQTPPPSTPQTTTTTATLPLNPLYLSSSPPRPTTSTTSTQSSLPNKASQDHLSHPSSPSIRPSPLSPSSISVTSTGTVSLDGLLAGHGGLVLGSVLLIEEGGTTDYAGALLRCYAAEGVVGGGQVVVLGIGEGWGRSLPGLSSRRGRGEGGGAKEEAGQGQMKIAWRYEGLRSTADTARDRAGGFVRGAEAGSEGDSGGKQTTTITPFCHSFDLAKRLVFPAASLPIQYIPIDTRARPDSSRNPFDSVLTKLSTLLTISRSEHRDTIYRIVIPSLLNPAVYPTQASRPEHILTFLHRLKVLVSSPNVRATAMISLPLDLFPRSTGLVRWMEILCDGTIELTPFSHSSGSSYSTVPATQGKIDGDDTKGKDSNDDEEPQGLLHVHKLPAFHDLYLGSSEALETTWTFALSRRRFVVKPYSLPPVGGDDEAQAADGQRDGMNGKKATEKADIEF